MKVQEKKIKEFLPKNISNGRWTKEEIEQFEENYKLFLLNKISKKELKSSIPTRTFQQVTSHWTKMKYYLKNKYSCLQNPHKQKEIKEFSNYFLQEQKLEKDDILVPFTDVNLETNICLPYKLLLKLKELAGNKRKIVFDDNICYNLLKMQRSEKNLEDWLDMSNIEDESKMDKEEDEVYSCDNHKEKVDFEFEDSPYYTYQRYLNLQKN